MEEFLPPLQSRYGEQLEIVFPDTSTPGGHELYETADDYFHFERPVVPIIILGDTVLLGGDEIEASLPGLIEEGLTAGGVDWPAIPGFEPEQWVPKNDLLSRIRRDMPGNGIAIVVLCGMVLSVGYVLRGGMHIWQAQKAQASRQKRKRRKARVTGLPDWWDWTVVGLCVLGLIVAGYLAYVETTLTEAECGPVGDCNAVQQSEFARFFGLIPIGVLGVAGYVAILAVWALGKFGGGRLAELAPALLLGLALFGTVFSIYLTFLEPFVIGATCMWCLTSAAIMTLLLLLVARPGWGALWQEGS